MYLSKNLEDVKSSCEIQPVQSNILNGQRSFQTIGEKESGASGDIAQVDSDDPFSGSPRDFIDEIFGVKAKPKNSPLR